MKPDFETFLNQLEQTNRTLNFFCDFEKIIRNVDRIKLQLCMLNSLIGIEDLRKGVSKIWKLDKDAFQVLGLLIAVRNPHREIVINKQHKVIPLRDYFETEEGVHSFLVETGLGELLQTQKITNLIDYSIGIETGLDSNARKNRGGIFMESIIAQRLTDASIKFQRQKSGNSWDVIQSALGVDNKVFDFAIETKKSIYLMEVNFYSSFGSKLNEVARSYTEIAPIINAIDGFNFVWITDGRGWWSAKPMLAQAYNHIPLIYNLTTLDTFIEAIKRGEL